VPAESKILKDTIHLNNPAGLVAILNLHPRLEWVLQELDVPISVVPDARILLRIPDLEDSDCFDLQEEISLLPVHGKRNMGDSQGESSTSKRQRINKTTSSAIVIPILVPASPSESALVAVTPASTSGRPIAPIPFPLTFVCDMIKGMNTLANMNNTAEIRVAFGKEFPGCNYAHSTFYKHRQFYKRAQGLGLIDNLEKCGHTKDGLWSSMVATVEAATKSKSNPVSTTNHHTI
jgi:hypothetical protein